MEETHLAEAHEIPVPMLGKFAQDQVVLDLDLEQLPGPDQVSCDLDIGLRRGRVTSYAACGISRVMPYPVLCRM